MYRRNIKHILGLFAVLITFFIFYQAWLKPHYFHETPPTPQVVIEQQPSASSAPLAPPQEHVAVEIPRSRTIDPVSIPVPRHSELLGAIHEELEKRNLARGGNETGGAPIITLYGIGHQTTRGHFVEQPWNPSGKDQWNRSFRESL